ncbi:hypothetical protein BH23CHL2_BH23CHL2_31870 [soil metagenome]
MSESHAGQIDATYSDGGRTTWRSALLSLSGLTLALSIIGGGIAAYLTYTHYNEGALVCSVGGGCHTVQESSYATIGPIPIAMLGLGMFLTLAGLAVARIFDLNWKFIDSDTATMASWGITLSALLYYAYLVYIEIFVLEAICQWCVATTVFTVAIFAVESYRLRSVLAIDEDDLID